MTTQRFSRLVGPTVRAISAVRSRHCQPPTYRPAEATTGSMPCTACGSSLHYSVTANGQTSGRCVAVACIRWSMQ